GFWILDFDEGGANRWLGCVSRRDPHGVAPFLSIPSFIMANWFIRPFEDCDEAEVIRLWSGVFGYATAHNDPATGIGRKRQVQRELFFVAVLEGRPVGTVMGGYDGHRGWVYSLAVEPDARGEGIGTALMRQLEAELQRRGCLKINLQVLASNAGVT